MITNLAAFLGISLIVIITPGPDTALTIRNTLVGGRRAGIATGAGVVSGLATWTVATSAGLAALIVASQPIFTAIRLVGAAYLVFLGLQALYLAIKPQAAHLPVHTRGERVGVRGLDSPSPSGGGQGGGIHPWRAYRQGIFSNLSNPKIVVFFLSLLPQFVTRSSASFFGLLLLGAIFCAITLVWLTLYAVVVARLGDVLRRGRIRQTIEAITGVVLVGLGLRLATSTR
jgi:threonine/homoserine/homoserine lactone efflux protein